MLGNDNSYKILGEVEWRLNDAGGNVLTEGRKTNVVTVDASTLMAMLVKNTGNTGTSSSDKAASKGVAYLAYGNGNWTTTPTASASTTRLVSELGRQSPMNGGLSYLTSDGTVSTIPTNRIKVQFRIIPNTTVEIREMGLFGGNAKPSINDDAYPSDGDLSDSGILMNYVTMDLITVASGSTLDWSWSLTF